MKEDESSDGTQVPDEFLHFNKDDEIYFFCMEEENVLAKTYKIKIHFLDLERAKDNSY